MNRVLLAAALAISTSCLAQYPNKPIRLIVGFPPGGSADPTTRIIGAALSEQMGQPVIVENHPGASANIGAEMVAKARGSAGTIPTSCLGATRA